MAIMKPSKVDTFQNDSERKSYELLKKLDNSYMVIYEPSIGRQRKMTPDFILLSEVYGLIVLDVKYVKLDHIKESNSQTLTKKDGTRMKNFYQIVKNYAYAVNNQLEDELKDNTTIVHPLPNKRAGKLTFPHSSGLLLFIHDEERYTKEDVTKILSLNENDFLIVNKIKTDEELFNFVKNLNRPFLRKMTSLMQGEILKKIYINSDAGANDFINTMSQFNLSLNKNFKEELTGTAFEKSKQLKINLLEYTKFAQNSIDVANKNLALGCDNIIEHLKGYKQELEDEKFTVAVFGYFSTGKSTFLNTLMGTDKLPMDEDRSTATFTRLRHCDESEDYENGDMEVIYKDKIDIEISYKEAINVFDFGNSEQYLNFNNLDSFKKELDTELRKIKIRDYDSSQRDKIKNAKKILGYIIENDIPYGTSDRVEKEDIKAFLTDDKKAFGISEVIYYLDNDLLRDIEIVDTPGYGSENTMDTFKTQEFVQEANVLILLTEAKDPMSKEDEHKFLETYEHIYKSEEGSVNTDNLFIIANKVDESTKTTSKIKKSIKNKIEDNWEDYLVVKEEKLFAMSAKYHYDKMISKDTTIKSHNISEEDLNNFIESYSTYLTVNKDKEIVRKSFSSIDTSIRELKREFDNVVTQIERDIKDIQNKKANFENNKSEITDQYELYSSSINSISRELDEENEKKLTNKKMNSQQIKNEFIKFLERKGKKSNNATKDYAKEFYEELATNIYKEIFNDNNSSFKNKLENLMENINKHIERLSIELEDEYGISGLDKSIVAPDISTGEFGKIEFEKGFFNSLLDIITFGRWVNAENYTEQMSVLWESSTKDKIHNSINKYNNKQVKGISNNFKEQSDGIVKSILDKLNDIERQINKKQKDKEEYNQKIDNMKFVFEKIDKLKETIKKQEKELYQFDKKKDDIFVR